MPCLNLLINHHIFLAEYENFRNQLKLQILYKTLFTLKQSQRHDTFKQVATADNCNK